MQIHQQLDLTGLLKLTDKWVLSWADSRGLKRYERIMRLCSKRHIVETLAVYTSESYVMFFVERLNKTTGQTWVVSHGCEWAESFKNHQEIAGMKWRHLNTKPKRKKRTSDGNIQYWLNNRTVNKKRFENAEQEEQRLRERQLLTLMDKKMLD